MALVGSVFVALTGVGIIAAAYPLGLGAFDRGICLVTGAVLISVAGMLARVDWERTLARPQPYLIAPAAVLLAVGVVGVLVKPNTQPLLAFVLLGVVYLGLTQRPGTTALAMPVILADWWLAFADHPPSVMMRLPLVILVSLLVGEGIAWRQRRFTSELASLWATSLTDPLTNVGNRRALARELISLPEDALVLFVDLDHFKGFNDRYGHAAGDSLLAQFAGVLVGAVRGGDAVARFGGEEFVILVGAGADGVAIYGRIRDAWNAVGGAVTFSAGIAHRDGGEPATTTLQRADAALYDAKLAGRDRYQLAKAAPVPAMRIEEPSEVAFADDEFTVAHLLNKMNQRHRGGALDDLLDEVVAEPID